MTNDPHERLPIAQAPISLVLTARNATASLDEILDGWTQWLEGLKRPFEILLVDEGSTDNTLDRADNRARDQPALRILRPEVRGVGAALDTGVRAAQYPLVCFAPCDKQY